MAAVMSHSQSASPPSRPGASTNGPPLPPIVTSPPLPPRTKIPSYASKRLSTFSNASSHPRSRPQSTVFPVFHSSLSYTLVRDFAYKPNNPLFYGPLPDLHSEVSTPASESHRRLSDPQPSWEQRGRMASSWDPGEQLPQTSFSDPRDDGPPYSEDEDIHSPVVTSSRHKKHKSNVVDFDRTRNRHRSMDDGRPVTFTGINGDGSQTYYLSEVDESANGPGGEYITYPPSGRLQDQSMLEDDDEDDDDTLPNYFTDEHRYSRDYQFTITDPAEEMHGKAVALFDFTRENDNELPLVEGQVILVSYRHGQGWLVAQDPKTGESGLVPEEYVRLLRDIEGGWSGLMNGQLASPGSSGGEPYSPSAAFDVSTAASTASTNTTAGSAGNSVASPSSAEARTPTRESVEAAAAAAVAAAAAGGGAAGVGGYYAPVVSTFSTSSKDLHPYPQHLLGPSQLSPPASAGQDGRFPEVGGGGATAAAPTAAAAAAAAKKKEEDEAGAGGAVAAPGGQA